MSIQQNPNLTDEQKRILFEKGTEVPFSGALLENDQDGTYVCANCGNPLFSSDTKFDSKSGWPSFYDVAHSESVALYEDLSLGMNRIEVQCKKCGGHLGHLFNDGPKDKTGNRYCVNSLSMEFISKEG